MDTGHATQFILNRSLKSISHRIALHRQVRSNFVAFNYFAEKQKLKPGPIDPCELAHPLHLAIAYIVHWLRQNLNSVFGEMLGQNAQNIRPSAQQFRLTRFCGRCDFIRSENSRRSFANAVWSGSPLAKLKCAGANDQHRAVQSDRLF